LTRVLVTGAGGFVGSRLVRRLQETGGYDPFAMVRPGGARSPLAESRTLVCDVTDRGATEAAVRACRPEVILHGAMAGGHPATAEDRLRFAAVAISGTLHLAEAALAVGVRRFVHLGSFLSYQAQERPVSERDPLAPRTFRGAAKTGAAVLLHQYAATCGLPLTKLRIFSVYGPGEGARRFIPAVLRAAREGTTLPLAPLPRHDFVYVEDVVDACLAAAEREVEAGAIYNIGGGVSYRNEEVVAEAEAATGRRIATDRGAYPPSPADGPFWQADIGKAERELGWWPRHSLRQGLEAYWEWMRSTSA
jgi:nucleoside-diphosphate-sugar epimerase